MPPKPKPPAQPQRPTLQTTTPPRSDSPTCSFGAKDGTHSSTFKAELLSSLRVEMAAIFKTELQAAMTENLSNIKAELWSVKSELSASITTVQTEVSTLKVTMGTVEASLSTCTDDIAITS